MARAPVVVPAGPGVEEVRTGRTVRAARVPLERVVPGRTATAATAPNDPGSAARAVQSAVPESARVVRAKQAPALKDLRGMDPAVLTVAAPAPIGASVPALTVRTAAALPALCAPIAATVPALTAPIAATVPAVTVETVAAGPAQGARPAAAPPAMLAARTGAPPAAARTAAPTRRTAPLTAPPAAPVPAGAARTVLVPAVARTARGPAAATPAAATPAVAVLAVAVLDIAVPIEAAAAVPGPTVRNGGRVAWAATGSAAPGRRRSRRT